MKRLIQLVSIVALMSFSSAPLLAQNNAIDKYYSDYAEDDRFTKVSISSKMFSLFTNIEADDPEEQQMIETISKLKGLKMIVGHDISDAKTLFQSFKKKASPYEELMTVENKDQELIFYINEMGGVITELVMITYEENSLIVLSLIGDIDLQELANLSGKMDIEGFEEFKNLENK